MSSLEVERLEAVWDRWPRMTVGQRTRESLAIVSRDLVEVLRDASALAYDVGRTDLAEQLGRWAGQVNDALASEEVMAPSATEVWLG